MQDPLVHPAGNGWIFRGNSLAGRCTVRPGDLVTFHLPALLGRLKNEHGLAVEPRHSMVLSKTPRPRGTLIARWREAANHPPAGPSDLRPVEVGGLLRGCGHERQVGTGSQV